MAADRLASLSAKALAYLKIQATSHFQEALDVQFGLFGHPVLVASTFPLAMTLNAMTIAAPADPEVEGILQAEAREIAASGLEGGWPYFNLCPECPPDADDLAAVLLLLEAASWPDRAQLAESSLQRLEGNEIAPGMFRTWLAETPSARQEVDERWGGDEEPVQTEVLAHLLYALLETQGDRFLFQATEGATWLLEQAREGEWSSFNYYGSAYGTFQVLRLLEAIARRDDSLDAKFEAARGEARRALRTSQREDGGWRAATMPRGVELGGGSFEPPESSGVLETAWALSTLSLLGSDPQLSKRALAFLEAKQAEDGGFEAEPFYFTIGLVPYQSRTLTTAIALQAISLMEKPAAARLRPGVK